MLRLSFGCCFSRLWLHGLAGLGSSAAIAVSAAGRTGAASSSYETAMHSKATFFKAAASSGKPRGLAWTQCAFQQGVLLARDRANGELVGLVGVTIGFEAIEGGGMEEVEAVGNLRAATAVFTHNGREWTTQGRAVFNLEPREVIERYKESLDAVA